MPKVEFAAFVAIDWADKEHAWVLQVAGSTKRQRGTLKQSPEEIDKWATGLGERFKGQPIALALEQSRGALICALRKYSFFTIFPVHPSTSSRFRDAIYPSGAKDDPKDADLILEILLHHRNHLRPLALETVDIRKLQELVEKRRELVDQKTAQTNHITALLKVSFPQILDWFDELGAPVVAEFLKNWPTLDQLQAAKPATILSFFQHHNCRSQKLNQRRLEQLRQSHSLTDDPSILEPTMLMVPTLLNLVAVLRKGIAILEHAIQQICSTHPDYPIFASFPGAGPALAPRLLAAFGTQRERFSHATQMQSLSGIAPVISRSGQSRWIHFRWACPKFLRQTFHEFAGLSIQQSAWARDFYEKQRAKGKGYHAAVRSLAFKWIRILYRCWQDRTEYSESRYQATLATSSHVPSTPPASSIPALPPVDFFFKESAGMWKLSSESY